MKRMYILSALVFLAACSCGGGKDEPAVVTDSVKTTPEALSFKAEGETLTLGVTASNSFQVYCDADWVTVDPSFVKAATGSVSVTVKENMQYEERTAEVVVKCGTLRHKVALTQAAATSPSIVAPDGYKLVWNDEFDKAGAPSSSEWWYETGAGGWGNNELQEYVAGSKDGNQLASISDGTLKIKAQKIGGTVYSIRMNTKSSWTYGWFEAKIKVSDVPGSWPAFWMMPQNFKSWPDDGEVDIMEYAVSTQGKDKSSSSIHCKSYNHTIGTGKTHVQPVSNAAGEFHVYACEWTKDGFKFYIDGKQHHSFANDGKGNYSTWPFYNPFYLKLNMAWGGNMGGSVNESGLPAVYEIDYVRVFQKK